MNCHYFLSRVQCIAALFLIHLWWSVCVCVCACVRACVCVCVLFTWSPYVWPLVFNVFSFRLERHWSWLSDGGPVYAANKAAPVCQRVYNSWKVSALGGTGKQDGIPLHSQWATCSIVLQSRSVYRSFNQFKGTHWSWNANFLTRVICVISLKLLVQS